MAKKAKKRPQVSTSEKADLTRLTQAEAASLIGKPSVWMRDNGHLFNRNPDNTYDAHDVVRATQTQFRAAELADAELEPVLQLCDALAQVHIGGLGPAVRLIERIGLSHGASGLAAVGQHLLEALRENLELYGEPAVETAEEIQEQAAEKIEAIEDREAARNYRSVLVCTDCQQYRWGRSWEAGTPPSGYAPIMAICPPCERPTRRRRGR